MSPPSPALLTHPQGSLRTYLGGHAPHAHSHAQVLLGVEGGLALEVDGRSAWVDATAGLVIPAGATHGFETRAGARVWVVDAPACLGLDRLRAFALPPGWAANLTVKKAVSISPTWIRLALVTMANASLSLSRAVMVLSSIPGELQRTTACPEATSSSCSPTNVTVL